MKTERKKATIVDLARKSGVSIATASRVINSRENVADATRERVLKVAKRIGFMPQHTTRRVTLGLVVNEIQKIHEVAYVGSVICALINHAAQCDVVLEILSVSDLERIYSHYFQGLIGLVFGKAVAPLRKVTKIPVLLINNRSEKGGFSTIAADHLQGARIGTEYLLKNGHERIALVQIEAGDWGAGERETGYRQAYAQAGVPVPEDLIAYLEGRSVEEGFDPVLRKNPTAVFVGGEDLSLAVANALIHRLKVKMPDELSLLTYETPITSYLCSPSLSTVAQPWDQLARQAIDAILSAIRMNSREPQHVLLPNELIIRQSVQDRSSSAGGQCDGILRGQP